MTNQIFNEGVLFLSKPPSCSSFSIVHKVRKCFHIQRVGHAGTLDPFAEGLLILLLGRKYTRIQDHILHNEKEYVATLKLGVATDTFDHTGQILSSSEYIPSVQEVVRALDAFQGDIEQLPPMFSAKKIDGKRLYELARAGKIVDRKKAIVHVKTYLEMYAYPHLRIKVTCSKGTYIRSIADEIGTILSCGAHLERLIRTRSGKISIDTAKSIECLHSFDEASKVLVEHTELFSKEYEDVIAANQY